MSGKHENVWNEEEEKKIDKISKNTSRYIAHLHSSHSMKLLFSLLLNTEQKRSMKLYKKTS